MKAIIPAAGYATRLYPLTKNRPKSLLEVVGKPIVEYIIEKMAEVKEISTVYIVTNEKFYQKFVDWAKGYQSPIPVEILNDNTDSNENRLGCIGDIVFTIKQKAIDEDMLQINGDSLFDGSLLPMHNLFREKSAAIVMLTDVKDKERAKRFAVVEKDESGKITYFKEKPEDPPSTLCSVATYFYPKETLKMFDAYLKEGNSPDQPGRFVEWLYKKQPVYGYLMPGRFYDIGSKDTLEEARNLWEAKK